jgi:peptidoglycan/LPS O-acetylase OafA/YrhL
MNLPWLERNLDRNNNFDLIRLLAAIQVVVYHGIAHLHLPIPRVLLVVLASFPGVPIFFFLSGMLVTYSLSATPERSRYFEKRIRRVYPGLVVAFLLALLMLAAFGRLGGAVGRPEFWGWALGQLTVFQAYNPSVFRDFGVGTVNGSLWTIPIEVTFYLVLPFLAAAGGNRLRLAKLVAVLSLLSFGFATVSSGAESLPFRIAKETLLPFFYQFGLGMLAYLYLEPLRAVVRGKGLVWFGLTVCCGGAANSWIAWYMPLVRLLGMGFLFLYVLSLALETKPISQKLLRGWDLSYGIYIFHMLAMNVTVVLGFTGNWGDLLAVLFVSAAVAALSWRFVEWPVISVRRERSEETV